MRCRVSALCRRLLPLALAGCFVTPANAAAQETTVPEAAVREAAPDRIELRDGERVVLLGATFIERLQNHGYFETLVTAALADRRISFRNLGWSGDTVQGEARAVFGTPADGFARLEKDLRQAKPTLVVLSYGGNEAHAGPQGLDDYRQQLDHLLERVAATGARIAFVSPRRYEARPAPLPDPASYNDWLQQYAQVSRELVEARGGLFIDAFRLGPQPLTDNGVHLTAYGHWFVAPEMAGWLNAQQQPWKLVVDATQSTASGQGTEVLGMTAERNRWQLRLRDRQLVLPPPPAVSPPDAPSPEPHSMMQIHGLAGGIYALQADGQELARATAEAWSEGVPLWNRGGSHQAEALRRAIQKKNELYFHRYRPQNETYLFLFRKHEQGENAVEIPQFDPLIEQQEAEIHQLAQPREYTLELFRVDR